MFTATIGIGVSYEQGIWSGIAPMVGIYLALLAVKGGFER